MFSTEIETPAVYRWNLAIPCHLVLDFQNGLALHEQWAYKNRLCLHVKANSDMHCCHMETFQCVALLCAKEHCCSSCTPALFCPILHGPMQNTMLSVKVQCCVVHYDSVCCSMAILQSADVLCVSTMLCAEAHALSWRVGAPWEEHKSSDSPGHKSLFWNYEQIYLPFHLKFIL